MQRLIFEQSPILLLLCLAIAIGASYFLYKARHSWGIWTNRLLFTFRTALIFLIAVLLLGPIVKLITNSDENPEVVFLVDDSKSIGEVMDSVKRGAVLKQIAAAKSNLEAQGYSASVRGFGGDKLSGFKHAVSDINSALKEIEAEYDGRNLASVVLVSDGIYNTGASPLYSVFKTPVHTVGIGDTVQKKDLVLHQVHYNKVAYQGNKFPIQVEVLVHALPSQQISVSVYHNKKNVGTVQQASGNKSLLIFDFVVDADKAGIQRFDIAAQVAPNETNPRNNATSIFVDVVEGKKKILLIAPSPHPDIKALRAVVEKNSNYEFNVHIPTIKNAEAESLLPDKVDLVIFHQSPDIRGTTVPLFKQFISARTPILVIVGQQTNLRLLPTHGINLSFESMGQWDETFGVPAEDFSTFVLPENLNNSLTRYPPLVTPFGKFGFPPEAKIILYQRIGSVPTKRPLLWYVDPGASSAALGGQASARFAVLAGEGIWRWRLKEYDLNENTETFDSFFSKLIQFMSSKDDKRKFRCFPVKQQFNDTEYVVFESQLFNDLYEPQFGSTVSLHVVDETGKALVFSYTPTVTRLRYQFNLPSGAYRYVASIIRNGKKEEDRGQFSVSPLQIESQNLTADFQLLRTLSNNSGGRFFSQENVNALSQHLSNQKAPAIVHSEESFHPLIDLKLLFVALLMLISTEWFFRKYLGSY
jgi:hypothetical protein